MAPDPVVVTVVCSPGSVVTIVVTVVLTESVIGLLLAVLLLSMLLVSVLLLSVLTILLVASYINKMM